MKQKSLLKTIFLLCALVVGNVSAWADTYEQLTSIANIDESAEYVLGIDGTGFHYEGTSSWGKTALPSAQTPIKYTLTKAQDGNSFTAQATISGTTYYLQVPTSNTFSMATSAGTNTDLIIGTTQVSGTNYAVANKTTTARHLRINGTSGLRSYAGTTGTMAFFYKVVVESSAYTITVQSNNESYGTVSLSGATITATPATGYRVSTTTPYTINSGTATVTQDGNQFTVTASTDCTITINFEAKPTVSGYTVDFESDATEYSDWTFTNIESNYKHTEVDTHGGLKYGHTSSNYSTGSIQTKEKVNPASLTCYVSKQSTNTTTSTWYVQVSSDGSNWTNAGSRSASDMTMGKWKEFTVDLSNYSDVYVRVYYSGSTAIRLIDDLTLVLRDSDTPFINADDVELEYDATTGSISYAINNGIEGGVLTAATTASWINLGTVGETIPFTCDANTESTARTATVTLTYTYETNKTVTKDVTITQAAPVVTTTYTLANAIVSGKHYIITNESDAAMGLNKGNNRDAVEIEINDGTTSVLSDAGVYEFVIYGPDADGRYSIYDEVTPGYLYAASSGNNYLKTQASNDINGKWSISFNDDGVASIVADGSNNRNVMQYNSSSSLFSCYASDSQSPVYLYEKNGEATPTESRTLNEFGYATYCSQNALDFTNAEGVTAWAITGVNGENITFSQITGKVPAGTGMLLKGAANASVTMTSATGATALSSNLLIGTLAPLTINANEYFGLSGDTFVPVLAGTVPAGKALLPVPAVTTGSRLTFVFEDATGIATIENGMLTNDRYYNLSGQRVNNPKKGMYIVNGKKVVVK